MLECKNQSLESLRHCAGRGREREEKKNGLGRRKETRVSTGVLGSSVVEDRAEASDRVEPRGRDTQQERERHRQTRLGRQRESQETNAERLADTQRKRPREKAGKKETTDLLAPPPGNEGRLRSLSCDRPIERQDPGQPLRHAAVYRATEPSRASATTAPAASVAPAPDAFCPGTESWATCTSLATCARASLEGSRSCATWRSGTPTTPWTGSTERGSMAASSGFSMRGNAALMEAAGEEAVAADSAGVAEAAATAAAGVAMAAVAVAVAVAATTAVGATTGEGVVDVAVPLAADPGAGRPLPGAAAAAPPRARALRGPPGPRRATGRSASSSAAPVPARPARRRRPRHPAAAAATRGAGAGAAAVGVAAAAAAGGARREAAAVTARMPGTAAGAKGTTMAAAEAKPGTEAAAAAAAAAGRPGTAGMTATAPRHAPTLRTST